MRKLFKSIVLVAVLILGFLYLPLKAITNSEYRSGTQFAFNFQLKNASGLTQDLSDSVLCSSIGRGVITIDGQSEQSPDVPTSADWQEGCVKTMHLIRIFPGAS